MGLFQPPLRQVVAFIDKKKINVKRIAWTLARTSQDSDTERGIISSCVRDVRSERCCEMRDDGIQDYDRRGEGKGRVERWDER